MLLNDQFYCILYLFFFSYVAWTAINLIISCLLWESFDSFVDILYLSADDVDGSTMEKESFGYSVANSSCSATDQDKFSFVEAGIEYWCHILYLLILSMKK